MRILISPLNGTIGKSYLLTLKTEELRLKSKNDEIKLLLSAVYKWKRKYSLMRYALLQVFYWCSLLSANIQNCLIFRAPNKETTDHSRPTWTSYKNQAWIKIRTGLPSTAYEFKIVFPEWAFSLELLFNGRRVLSDHLGLVCLLWGE